MKLLVESHPACLEHAAGPGHPERPARVVAAVDGIREAGLGDAVAWVEPRPATVEDVPEVAGLLGLYDGVPLTERDGGYAGMVMPDRITLYRIPICAMARTEEQVVDIVRDTVINEVAPHFGIDADSLDELGWA